MRSKLFGILLFGICLSLAGSALAEANFQFGFKGGANRGRTDLESPPGDLARDEVFGFGGGAVVSVGLSPIVGIDTDLLYLRKGVHTEYYLDQGGFTTGVESDLDLDYVIFSPMIKVGGQGKSISPYFLAGPEMGVLVNSEITETTWHGSPNTKTENGYDVTDFMETVSWGWSAGGGLEFPTGGASVFVEGRYAQGVSNIWTDDHTGAWGEEKPSGIYFFGGVRF